MGDTHPALPETTARSHRDHYVARGWEDLDRGLCSCGEAVRWDPAIDSWVPDRNLIVLVLTRDEVMDLINPDDEEFEAPAITTRDGSVRTAESMVADQYELEIYSE